MGSYSFYYASIKSPHFSPSDALCVTHCHQCCRLDEKEARKEHGHRSVCTVHDESHDERSAHGGGSLVEQSRNCGPQSNGWTIRARNSG